MARYNGTSSGDTLTGRTTVSDLLYGLGGNDTLNASGTASDTLYGGAGNDTFNITSGTHTVADFSKTGTNGVDTLNVSAGATAIVTGVLDFTGYAVTGSGTVAINGTTRNDTIKGTSGVDSITGGNGDDTLTGNGGDDIFNVTSGTDTIIDLGIGSDDDGLIVRNGAIANVTVYGLNSHDALVVNNGKVNLYLRDGADVDLHEASGTSGFYITADDNSNISDITGSDKSDTIIGGNAGDYLDGGNGGNDILTGGTGNDYFSVSSGTGTVTDLSNGDMLYVGEDATANATVTNNFTANSDTGNWGTANLTLTNDATNVSLVGADQDTETNGYKITTSNIATSVTGSRDSDTIIGGAGRDSLDGYDGDDTLSGGAGNDSLWGGLGEDYLDGGIGADVLTGGDGDDIYVVDNVADAVVEEDGDFDAGIDTVRASVSYTLTAHVDHLTLTGNGALNGTGNELDNELIGNSAVNVLTGGLGDDTLNGGAGADKLYGGAGDDTYIVDNTGDKVFENADEGNDTVESRVSHTLAANVENLILTGNANLSGTGNELDNDITGTIGNNSLNGKAGNDSLEGLAGNDMLNGDAGEDTLIGGNGNDTLKGGSDNDSLEGGLGNDVFNVESGTDTINDLGVGNDVLVVASGATANATLLGDFTATSATKNNGTVILTQDDAANLTVINLAAAGGTAGYTVNLNNEDAVHVTGSKFNDIFVIEAGDTEFGGAAHTIEGGAGNDTFRFANEDDLAEAAVFGGTGSDTIVLTGTISTVTDDDFDEVYFVESLQLTAGTNSVTLGLHSSSAGLATVTGGTGVDTINADGSLVATKLDGGNGADVITGSDFADTITGGAGADNLTGGTGADVFIVSSEGGDTIQDFSVADGDVLDLSALTFDGTGVLEIATAGLVGTDIDSDVAVLYYTADDLLTTATGVDNMLDDQNGSGGAYHGNTTIVLTDDGTDTYVWLDGHRDLTGDDDGAILIAKLIGVTDCSTVLAQLDLTA